MVTGDLVVDTQLENMRKLVCRRVLSMYALVTRLDKVRLWPVECRYGDGRPKVVPASTIRSDDHPLIQSLIDKATELAEIDSISCIAYSPTGVEYVCSRLQIAKSQNRMRCRDGIDSCIKEIEKLGAEALKLAQDMIREFHAMAQQWRMHSDKMHGGSDRSDADLQRLMKRSATLAPTKLETFVDPSAP